jgi:hypothetical protein
MGSTSLVRGALSGLLAAVAMNLPMLVQRDGYVPAYVAAGAASGRDPIAVSARDAAIAHHVAGALAGVLYVLLARPVARLTGERIGRAVAAVGVVAFVDAFFSRIVFPFRGGEIVADDDRARTVRGAWRRSSVVFGFLLFAFGRAVTD